MKAATSLHHRIITFSLLSFTILLLASCTTVINSNLADTRPQEQESNDEVLQPALPSTVVTETLPLSQQEITFFDYVESQLEQAVNAPERRSYVELTSPDDVQWQGERHDFADHTSFYLQQSASSGDSAIHIHTPAGTDSAALAQYLPMPSPSADPPNVEVLFVQARHTESGVWNFAVTVEHPDLGWDDYADGWQIESPDGEILGLRILLHPHVDEQPFTRSLNGVLIPEGVEEVRIRAHDLVSGYGPVAVTLSILTAGEGALYEVIR